MKFSKVLLLVALLLTFGAFSTSSFGFVAFAQKDQPEDGDAHVETEDEVIEEGQPEPGTAGAHEDVTATGVEPSVVTAATDVEMSYILVDHSDVST